MPSKERLDRYKQEGTIDYQRRTKAVRQRRQRIDNPAVNGRTRQVLGEKRYLEVYTELLIAQAGRCEICGKPEKPNRRLHIDHDHKTNEIRGLLCYSCNTKLGFVEKYLRQIVRYLRDRG